MILECPACQLRYDASGRAPGHSIRCRCGESFPVPKAPPEGEVLRCPDCGAPCDPNSDRCSFCKAVLAVVACPRCLARVYTEAVHCQRCGAEVRLGARKAMDVPAVRKCPRCSGVDLGAHIVGDTLVDECPRCSGLWIERTAFDRLIRDRDAMASMDGLERSRLIDLDAPPTSKSAGRDTNAVVYLPCPDCKQLMNRKNYADRSGVILDICRPHGIWFDVDELGKVVSFVLRGGLDEARRREAEEAKRQLSAARAEIARAGAVMPATPDFGDELRRTGVDVLVDMLLAFFK